MKKLLLSALFLGTFNFCSANPEEDNSSIKVHSHQLHDAVIDDDLEQAKKLLEAGADVEVLNGYNATPLCCAAFTNNQEMMQLFLDYGANVNWQYEGGNTALHAAVSNGSLEAVKLLLKYNANSSIRNNDGKTPLEDVKEVNMLFKKMESESLLIIKELEKNS